MNSSYFCPIAKPLADEKRTKRVLKLIEKSSKHKNLKRGVKEVVKSLKKGQKGVVVLAANVTPVDVISHIPLLCEETGNFYVYIPLRTSLGGAAGTRRATSCVMVSKPSTKDTELYELYEKSIKDL